MFIYMALLLISITSSYKKTSHWLWIISTNNTPSTNYGSKRPIMESQNFRTITVGSYQYIFNHQGNLHQIRNITERFSHIRFSFDGTRPLGQIIQDLHNNNYTLPQPDN